MIKNFGNVNVKIIAANYKNQINLKYSNNKKINAPN